MKISSLDRRKFIRGAGVALTLPWLETFAASNSRSSSPKKRLACFYIPDGVPMPLQNDPAFQDWSWFPHGHDNADQFLTGADTSSRKNYKNGISIDQLFAAQIGSETRHDSLVLSTDGGTGGPRSSQTMSYNKQGRPIPAENRPKLIFDQLFVKSNGEAARRLAVEKSALDQLMDDARSLKRHLSKNDQETLAQYLQSVRETEQKVEKARKWIDTPLPVVKSDTLNLNITPEDPRNYLRTMFELIYLAFQTDSTRSVTYQIGRENGVGISDFLARSIGFNRAHMLSHDVKKPGGWQNFGTYHRFLANEWSIFLDRLKSTPEPGNMLENTLAFYGSASSAFHLSRNYPLIVAGGQNMGLKQGQYLRYGNVDFESISGQATDDIRKVETQEDPMGRLLLTMLQQLGVETKEFAGCTKNLPDMLA